MTEREFTAWLKRMGFTYKAAADALGVSDRTLYNYASGMQIPLYIELACEALERRLHDDHEGKPGAYRAGGIEILDPADDARVPSKLFARIRTPSGSIFPQLLVFSGDNLWHPQGRPQRIEDTRKWKLKCWIGNPQTPSGVPFRLVAVHCSHWIEKPLSDLPSGVEMSDIITVYRDDSPFRKEFH